VVAALDTALVLRSLRASGDPLGVMPG
jgi:hypothetical protein